MFSLGSGADRWNSKMFSGRFYMVIILALSFFRTLGDGATLVPDEINTLKEIATKLGKTNWNFNVDPCTGLSGWKTINAIKDFENNVTCDCSFLVGNDTVCHITTIILKAQSLPGVLPRELSRLPYLQEIDLTRNYLGGTIPVEWGVLPLVNISLLGNRVSGQIPKEIGNITTLKSLVLESNQLSGVLPPELGNLTSIERILISSNNFTGELPETLAKLVNLTDFRINDNGFTGKIPNFIKNWIGLEKLAIQASGLEGPIPLAISALNKITDMRISDMNGIESTFPLLPNMEGMKTLVLRNCNITGEIPPSVGGMTKLKNLDLSFNKLSGKIPFSFESLSKTEFMYLTGNLLNGPVPNWMATKGKKIDLSYNNFTLEETSGSSCQKSNVNLFGGSLLQNNSIGVVPCLENYICPSQRRPYLLHINCGGKKINVNGNITYSDDMDAAGSAKFFINTIDHWAFSSTGNFMDDGQDQDILIATNTSMLSMPNWELYEKARLSPTSLTYYGLCLVNGNYTVKLHFAEIIFTDNKSYSSLGRRIFDIYLQGKLVLKDFNIADEDGGPGKAVIKNFTAVSVTNKTLEIRLYWAGKGTTSIPMRGTYGPLISAISVDPEFDPPLESGGKEISAGAVVGIIALSLFLIFLILCILWMKGYLRGKNTMDRDLQGLDLQTGSFTLRQIKAATNNFDAANKIGEGGFGSVYKGLLLDGTIIAVKQLSSKSKQGNREFVNEIGMISALQHPNLVKLYGCCIEGNQLLLVYEYMENNCLARALFGPEDCQLHLDWPTRHKICVGIARGLAYLHEESRLKIVHRDIKATNVLLDKDLAPKISDFGLAKLDEEENTHISTRIAGTIGYMAPEYAMRGYLTDKADVYSFGIVALEIVSGKSNTNYRPKEDCVYLLDWACVLQERGTLIDLVDPKLGAEFNKEEALGMLTVALLCANAAPTLRPTMSAVVSMLEGRAIFQDLISDPSFTNADAKFKAMRNHIRQTQNQHSMGQRHSRSISMDGAWTGSSTSVPDLYPVTLDSDYWKSRE